MSEDDRERYFAWNSALGDHFFSLDGAQRPVYLDIEDDVLTTCAQATGDAGDPESAFLSAVVPTLGETGLLFDWHVRQVDAWRRSASDEAPPSLAVLALAVLAAEKMQSREDVSATNYYMPFFELAGRRDEYVDQPGQWQKGYRRHIEALWGALNDWLEDWEGERGLPTARPRGQNRFVSMAISQALVREADRAHLPRFFSWVGLRPGVDIDEERMERLLDEWVPSSPLSRRIKRRWPKSGELREAFASVAISELLTWDGTVTGGSEGAFEVRLIAVTSRRRPLRVLIAVEGSPKRPPSDVTIGEVTHTPDWTQLWPGTWLDRAVPEADPLSHDVVVGGRTREWQRVNVFRNEGAQWVETRNVDRESTHLVLCESNFAAVAMVLDKIAPGYRRQDDPVAGWTAFHDVHVIGTPAPEAVPGQLTCLSPLTRDTVLLKGGLKYPGRPSRWHPDAPPQAVISVGPADTYELGLQPLDGQAEWVALGSGCGPAVFELPAEVLADTLDRRVTIRPQGASAALRLRTSDRIAVSYEVEQPRLLCRCPAGGPARALWGHPKDQACGSVRPRSSDIPERDMPAEIGWALHSSAGGAAPADVTFGEGVGAGSRTVEQRHPACTDGGYHLMFEKMGARKASANCIFCGRGPGDTRKITEVIEGLPSVALQDGAAETTGGRMRPEALLDALGHVRGGRQDALHRWLGMLGYDAVWRHNLLADLQALAFLELSAPGANSSWHVTAPALIAHANHKRWLMTGNWRPSLLMDFSALVEDAGGQMATEYTGADHAIAGLPIRTVLGVDSETITELAEAADLELREAPDGTRLPRLDEAVRAGCQEQDLPATTDLEYYDPGQARFRPGRGPEKALLRIEIGYRPTYWWAEGRGRGRSLPDGAAGKFLAASMAGNIGLAYLVGTLVTPIGSRLPSLYERTIVTSAFALPITKGGVTAYQGVDAEVARRVHQHVTPW